MRELLSFVFEIAEEKGENFYYIRDYKLNYDNNKMEVDIFAKSRREEIEKLTPGQKYYLNSLAIKDYKSKSANLESFSDSDLLKLDAYSRSY